MKNTILRVANIHFILFLTFLAGCSPETINIDKEDLVSFEYDAGKFIDTKDGINSTEAQLIEFIRVSMVSRLCKSKLAAFNKPVLNNNVWILKEIFNRAPWELHIDSKTGTIIKGCSKPITLSALIKAASRNNSLIKQLSAGYYQIYPKIVVSNKDGIDFNEAQTILQMYAQTSRYGATNQTFTPPDRGDGYWVSTKVGHWEFKRLKHPVKVDTKNGDIVHGDTYIKLKDLVTKYKTYRSKMRANLLRR